MVTESEMTTGGATVSPGQERRQELTGVVTSAKMEKTIVVKVTRSVSHRKYSKVIRVSKKFYAHDEERQAREGDTVRIVASRPLSKLKRWRLGEIISRSPRAEVTESR